MTVGLLKGVNKGGHKGWTTVKCVICNKNIDLFEAYDTKEAYYCPRCTTKFREVFFCAADARRLHYRCPYCGSELKPYFPL
ncbi:MAG: hypothetical protein ABWK00_04200 [Desulfurococcaceae archaeon]